VLVLPDYKQSTFDLVGVGPLVKAEKDRPFSIPCSIPFFIPFFIPLHSLVFLAPVYTIAFTHVRSLAITFLYPFPF
jgi:hypothetical protein